MSTKPCPQCGSAVPSQARFCGQCGRTFVPTTLDEATADPPSPGPASNRRPPLGMGTIVGHAAVMPPPGAGKTLFDPAPRGAQPPGEPVTSQRPTPLVPAPADADRPGAVPDAVTGFGQTVADPEVSARAQRMRDLALAEASATSPVAPAADVATRRQPAFGKTMMLGGAGDSPAASAALTVPVPPRAGDPPPESQRLADASPLSRSVAVPSSWVPPAKAEPVQPAPIGGPPPGAPGSDKHTMLGMPAVGLAPPQAAAPAPQAVPPAFKTMLGVAIPGIAPTHEAPPPQPAPPPRAGTLLGIAAPGIAPLQPGAPHNAGPPHHHVHARQPQREAPPIVPAPAPLVMEPLPEAPQVPKKKGVPAIAVVGIVFVLVAIVAAAGALIVLRSGAPLTAQPQLDEGGKESLKIRCESCPDGTIVSLGASSSKVEGATTLLPLPAPLSIGDNDLEMKIDRPAAGRDETVKVHVPVAYRVKADLSTLTASPASVTVRVEAIDGTEVTVDGKAITLTAGKGSHMLDVSSVVEGPSDDQKTIDRKIPFTIKPKGSAAPENGQLAIRVSIAPLHIDAPGVEPYTDRATGNVSGQVKPGGTLTIDGQNVAVDAQGRFGVRVELPSPGEKNVTIVASAPPLAPRTLRSKIVRVPSLEAAAKTLDAKSPISFETYAADPKSKIGQLALVDGELQDVRVTQGHTVMAVEEKKTCTRGPGACLVRVVHGEEVKAARGDSIRAYGRVEGTATLNGATIPDVEGALVITKPAAKK
ncbi:MAG TPA: hypothetical protein VM925_10980 [Labilithrix sp.]|nr:hypothetical protein [Labilithrix sp.]